MGEAALRILVTGASRGIGREIAQQLLDSGHNVAVTARSRDDLEDLVTGYSNSMVIVADSTQPKSAEEAVSKVVNQWNGLDVLIINAGDGSAAPIEKTTDEIWDKSIAINLTAPFHYLRAAVPTMKNGKFGRVVVIASTAGLEGEPNVSAYTAAKHGVIGLVRSSAAELAKQSFFTPARREASRTWSRPRTLRRTVSAGSDMDSGTLTKAARWKT